MQSTLKWGGRIFRESVRRRWSRNWRKHTKLHSNTFVISGENTEQPSWRDNSGNGVCLCVRVRVCTFERTGECAMLDGAICLLHRYIMTSGACCVRACVRRCPVCRSRLMLNMASSAKQPSRPSTAMPWTDLP